MQRNATTTTRCALLCTAAVVAALASGCASAPATTGVVAVGPDTYRVAARGKLGVPSESRKDALLQADRFCGEKGRSMQVTETGKAPLTGPYEVTFQCPADDDGEAGTAPVSKKAPSEVAPVR